MAGIGFELRKLYGRKTLASSIWGTIYATMSTIGPSVLFAMLVLGLKGIMDFFAIAEIESRFFISSFSYIFLAAILVMAFFNTVISRYISDCIFEKKESSICSSLFGVLALASMIMGIVMLVLCVKMYRYDNIEAEFLLIYYWLGILAADGYILIIYVSALKQYKEVTFSYFLGLVTAACTFWLLFRFMGIHLIMSAYTALVCGFFVINLLLVFFCVKAFGSPDKKYFTFLRYFKRYPMLMLSGFCYMLGFYITTMIYWRLSDMSEKVSIFYTAPNYDMAMFLAIAVNMPSLVIFVVKVETAFFDKYVAYLSALNGGSYDRIEKERASMCNIIHYQLFYIYEVQLIITVILICLINVFFPYLDIGAQVLNMFIVLGMGLYCTFSMYFTVIFLYYFEDHKGACAGPVLFVVVTTLLALVFSRIGKPFYPIPLLIGGITGWVTTFFVLKHRLKNLNAFLMCR